jgi:hypothetical protein
MTTIDNLTPETALMRTLDAALSLARPHGSRQVADLGNWILHNLPEHLSCSIDAAGNIHIDARTDTHHRTLFVAHLDTVHRSGGPNKILKTQAKWTAGDKDKCLGADDGAGVAMLMHLLWGGVPGYYVFSQGEECGGIGAKFLSDKHDATLLQHDRAIAFDRKGIDSVITHQGFGRCCSDEFALALATALNGASGDELFLSPDETGVYTDTAEFTGQIPECTNISIGYEQAHSDREWLDIYYIQTLAAAAVKIDWDALPTKRDPSVVEHMDYNTRWGSWDWGGIPDVPVAGAGGNVIKLGGKQGKHAVYGKVNTMLSPFMQLEDALDDAFQGIYTPLIEMIAENAYPEDPSIARKQISKNLLTDEVLAWAEDELFNDTPIDHILDALFDGAQMH